METPGYWSKQTDERLFPDVEWNRPLNKQHAGKLLIIGGSSHGFMRVAQVYEAAEQAGIGAARVVLPDAVRAMLPANTVPVEFAPSNPSGGFAKDSIRDVLGFAGWADGVLLAGEFGRNSQTAILVESFLQKYAGFTVVTKDSVDYLNTTPGLALERPSTLLVASLSQMQKILQHYSWREAVRFSMNLPEAVRMLHEITAELPVSIVTVHHGSLIVGVSGRVSTTALGWNDEQWQLPYAARAAVQGIQQPGALFEVLTDVAWEMKSQP